KDEHHEMEVEDAEVVVVLGSVLHEIGMSIHRDDHEFLSLFIARPILQDILRGVYKGKEKIIMISEILGAILPHDRRSTPLTVEAGILSIADALDMAEGRARIPFDAGKVDIHSVSAMSINNVKIEEGGEGKEPVQVTISMHNSAGIFQVDELLKKKVIDSGLDEYFRIVARIEGEEGEKKILKEIEYDKLDKDYYEYS
ncbi:MAG: HD domain-containing protein, partial [Hadesarchaea archaeon]|nr:HD domain-containing protein [Hadesarchaea archaeon]